MGTSFALSEYFLLSPEDRVEFHKEIYRAERISAFIKGTPEFSKNADPLVVSRLLKLRNEMADGTENRGRTFWIFYLEKLVTYAWNHPIPGEYQQFLDKEFPGFTKAMLEEFWGYFQNAPTWR